MKISFSSLFSRKNVSVKSVSRRARRSAYHDPVLESLEPRTLLAGVTIITHGLGGDTYGWIPAMTSAIAAQANLSNCNFVTYTMTVTDPNKNGSLNVTISKTSGTSPLDSSKSPEILIDLDWSAVAGDLSVIGIFGGYSLPTSVVGAAVAAALIDPTFLTDLGGAALASLPIHLIGHSRGASLVGQIALDLGKSNIWVDQLTTFDPVPSTASSYLYNDPVVRAFQNVIFFDNYFQKQDSFATGFAVSGAHNVGPLSLPGGYASLSIVPGGYHNNVHLYYLGTISPTAREPLFSPSSSWYSGDTRTTTGFAWTTLGGATRPADGIGKAFGGTASRTSVSVTQPAWADIGFLSITSGSAYTIGQNLTVNFKYQDQGSKSTITWYLDTDQNPFNGNEIALTTQNLAAAKNITNGSISITLPTVTSGTYYLLGYITDAAGSRLIYASTPISIVSPTTVIGSPGSESTRQNAFDGNLNTYFNGPTPNGNWVGLQFSTAKRITKISFAPRNDITNGPDLMIGGIFQASNDPTFTTGVVNLYTITSAPDANGYTVVTINNPNAYKYFRYLSPDGSYGNVAEIKVNTSAIAGPDNHAPALTSIANFSGAVELSPYTITYAALAGASNAADIDGDDISFLIQAVNSGTLLINGSPVVPGTTLVTESDTLTWIPSAKSNGIISAFSVKAFDGALTSASPVTVKISTILRPTVSVTASKSKASETKPTTSGKGTYTFTRTGSTTDPLTIDFTLSGTAADGDYVTMPTSVTIPAGKKSVTLDLIPIDNGIADGTRTVILTLASSDNYTITPAKSNATITIADNSPTLSITAKKLTVARTAQTSFTLKRAGGNNAGALTVTYTLSGTASNGTDYTSLSGSVTFLPGKSSATINLIPLNNNIFKDPQTVTITIDSSSAYYLGSAPSSATITILANAPQIAITTTKNASEIKPTGSGKGTFTLTRTGPTNEPLTITYTVSGSATPDSNYPALSGSATFPKGKKSITITIIPIADGTPKELQNIILTLDSSPLYAIDPLKSTATMTIIPASPI